MEPLRELLGFDEASECWQAIYLKDTPLPVGDFDIRRLDLSYAPFVAEHYNGPDCLEYMQWQINDGAMLGALQENISMFRTEDDTQINMYCVIPLYKEEMEYQKAAGTEALMQKLSVLNGYGMTFISAPMEYLPMKIYLQLLKKNLTFYFCQI